MPASCVQVFIHYVWATWDRLPMVSPELEPRLHAAIAAECRRLGCEPLEIGGTEDHVHALVRLGATASVAELARRMKGGSSHLATHTLTRDGFRWQGSYGAFSVSVENLERVRSYIARQKEHHACNRVDADWERCSEIEDS